METDMSRYTSIIKALQRHEDEWRRSQDRPDVVQDAVMTALYEVRAAFMEAEQLEDLPVTPATPTEIVNPPRDQHLPQEMPAPSRS
jgi:hypothetical protein